MYLLEAYEKSKVHDNLKCSVEGGGEYEERRDFIYGKSIPFRFALSDEWQIMPKEPELIAFADAAIKMKIGQVFKIGSEKGGEELTMVNDGERDMEVFSSDLHDEYVLVDPDLLTKKGRILLAETEVLSAEEWLFDTYGDAGPNKHIDFFTRNVAIGAFQKGEENQWLNHKELREAVEKWRERVIADNLDGRINREAERLCIAIKNIKPLKAE